MIDVLFIVTNEVTRRSIEPVFDIFLENGFKCGVVANSYCVKHMQRYVNHFIGEKESRDLVCNFVVSANPIPLNAFKGRRVSIPHGSMFGNSAWSLLRAIHSDIYFGVSPGELPYIKRNLNDKFNDAKFFASGCPQNDYLINLINASQEYKSHQRELLGLNKKTILLTSHWQSIGNLRRFGAGLLDALVWNFPNHQIICTCHPTILNSPKTEFRINQNVRTPHFDSKWLIQSLKSKASKQVKVILDEKKSSELLLLSDLFIGDNSSILIEASMFKMPLMKSNGGFYFDKKISEIVSLGTHGFGNIEELLGGIQFIETSNSTHIKTGKEICDLFNYNVGCSAMTIFNKMNEMS